METFFLRQEKPETVPSLPQNGTRLSSPYLEVKGFHAQDTCKNCQYHRPRISGQRAVSLYQEPLRDCIHRLKYDGNTRLAGPLGLLLAQAYKYYSMQADVLVPVPLHSERQQQRGFNHALLLAEVCSANIGVNNSCS